MVVSRNRRGYVQFNRSSYLGGHPDPEAKRHRGGFFFTDDKLGIGITRPKHATIKLADVASISILSANEARANYGAAVEDDDPPEWALDWQTAIVVRTHNGETAFYTVATTSPPEVRDYLTPNLERAGIPFVDGTTSGDAP